MQPVKILIGIGIVILIGIAFGGGWLAGRLGIGRVVSPESLPVVEREFAERMTDVRLVGTFSVSGSGREPREDGYEIASVEKIGDDLWRFNARLDCCGLEGQTIPIAVPMTFVGDTPMIMMTDTSLAGIGTFTVRLFFYEDRYAGTWQNGNVGGPMTGRIEPQPDDGSARSGVPAAP